MQQITSSENIDPSLRIAQYISSLADWRGNLLARLHKLVLEVDPEIVEEWKWETPVWSHKGNVLAISAFQDHVKINFFKGASLADAHGLFNAGLEAKASRAIDIYQGGVINEEALQNLIRAAVQLNLAGGKKK